MTYSILAKCSRTGRFGMGIATYSVAVGQWCHGLNRRSGITMSQAFVRTTNNELGVNLLRLGHSAAYVQDVLLRNDEFPTYRQIGTISSDGQVACHTGPDTRGWAGHHVGAGYVAMGNVLSGSHIVDAMAEAFESVLAAPLDERLLLALEAGRDAGGQGSDGRFLPERSSALLVTGSDERDLIDVRVDLHGSAVDELRRVHEYCAQYADFYRSRGLNPRGAPSQETFEKREAIRGWSA